MPPRDQRPHHRLRRAQHIGRSTRWTYLQELKRRNVRILTNTKALRIELDCVIVESRGAIQTIPARSVVLALGYRPSSALGKAIEGRVPALHVIGDAHIVQNAEAAIRHGFEIALTL